MPASHSKASKVVASLKSSLKAKNTQQLKDISEACDNDFELQLLVLKTISDHNSAKLLLCAQSLSMQLAEDKKNKNTAAAAAAAATDDQDWDIVPEGPLRRGLLYYKYWGQEMVFSALAYMEPRFRQFGCPKNLPILRVRGPELLSFALDVNCSSENPDRVAVENKEDLFPRLKAKHIAGGSRLVSLLEDLLDNNLDWAASGFYMTRVLSDSATARVTIISRIIRTESEIPAAVVGNKAVLFGAAPVMDTFSQASAYIEVDGEKVILGNYFQQDRRFLKWTASGASGIVLPTGFFKKMKPNRAVLQLAAEGGAGHPRAAAAGGTGENSVEGAAQAAASAGRGAGVGMPNKGRVLQQPGPPASQVSRPEEATSST